MSTARRRCSALLLLAPVAFSPLPALGQIRTAIPTYKVMPSIPAPQGLTAVYSSSGVQLSWQTVAEAGQYLVLRAPDVNTAGTQIGVLPAGYLNYLDKGFNLAAAYQIVAVAADGRRGYSTVVAYTPPTLIDKSTAFIGTRTLLTSVFPTITSISPTVSGEVIVKLGETVQVQGTGLDNLTSAVLALAECINTVPVMTCQVRAGVAPVPVTPQYSSTGFSFVVPTSINLGGYSYYTQRYFLVITKGTTTIQTDKPLTLAYPEPVRKITSVAQRVVRAGQRFKVTGVGFIEVIGGYAGTGTPGSTTNPMLNMWNRSDTYVELETPAGCRMEGELMLHMPMPAPATPKYISGDTQIMVGCAAATPTGYIVGSESSPNGILAALPGTSVSIRGTDLRWVTKVLDSQNRSYPFTYAKLQGGIELLSVTLPPTPGPYAIQFSLENLLTDPVLNGTVTGTISVMAPPTWNLIGPAWAEPGQLVRVNGRNLKYSSGATLVRVGGAAAQILSGDELTVTFRVPSTATAGPIEIENPAGKVQVTGPFTTGTGASHPGFFLVVGPSAVTQIVQPSPTLSSGDVLTVRGQNLARLAGICVLQASGAGQQWLTLRRPGGAGLGYETSNTEMQVVLYFSAAPASIAASQVQLYAPSAPVGDYPPSQFACAPNPAGISWP